MAGKANGIILAGGQSRRMGTDKALLRLQPNQPRLIELAVAALQNVTEFIVVSTNRPADYAWLNLPLVGDKTEFAGCGPLAGLEATLSLTGQQNDYENLVVACDMPALKPKLLIWLLEQARHTDADKVATVPLNREGQPEPLCAVYRPSALPHVRQALAGGRYKLTGWMTPQLVEFIPVEQVEKVDSDLASLANLNTPQEVQKFSVRSVGNG